MGATWKRMITSNENWVNVHKYSSEQLYLTINIRYTKRGFNLIPVPMFTRRSGIIRYFTFM